jgi:ribonuclease BN (tRNA processing enzyme)
VEVRGRGGSVLVLDAGTGVRRLGAALPPDVHRVDILLTHLHMDHIQGLGFFTALYNPKIEVHMWGPPSTAADLRARLVRYLSPPLFPVHLRDLPCRLSVHEVPRGRFDAGEFSVVSNLVCHPGPTVAYRIESPAGVVTYMPDHEPALGSVAFPNEREWTSGCSLAEGADLLIHDSQYTQDEYDARVGWGHSSVSEALRFARLAGVKHFVTFHHDPAHDDWELDQITAAAVDDVEPEFTVTPGTEGSTFSIGESADAV